MGKTDEKLISVANESLTNGNIEESQELKVEEIVKKKKPYIPPRCEIIKIESGNNLLDGLGLQASIQQPEDGGEITDAKWHSFSVEEFDMSTDWIN